jgi:hypothetical protein
MTANPLHIDLTLPHRMSPFDTATMGSQSNTMTERTTSAVAMLRLAASRTSTNRVPAWPSPELSVGHSCSALGRNKCWEVVGPALESAATMLRIVKELLDSRAEYLHEREPKTCFISFGVYMIGRDESRANPTLLISCERRPPRQRAVKLIREKNILRDLEGFRLAESSRPPLCIRLPISLGSTSMSASPDSSIQFIKDILYAPKLSETCGLPILSYYSPNGQTEDYVRTYLATMGGYVFVGNTRYGLSTAHSFVPGYRPEMEDCAELESEFEFGDDLDTQGDNDEGIDTYGKLNLKTYRLQHAMLMTTRLL